MLIASPWRFIAASFMIFCLAGLSHVFASNSPRIEQGWVRAPAPGQQAVAVYGRVYLPPGVKLLGVETDVAAHTMFHQTEHVNGEMRMREAGLPVLSSTGGPLVLASGGMHLMLTGLRRSLQAGEQVVLRWHVQSKQGPQTYTLAVPVKPLNAVAPR